MGNVLVKEETLIQIADAIREKNGSNDSYRPGEMPDAILDISTYSGEGADPNKPIRFYGPYGDLIYSYTVGEFSELSELPVLPVYKGLTPQCWNWSLENILTMEGETEIGSLYITDDGATRIYIELLEGALNPKIGFIQNAANSVWVDWGDGSPMETSDIAGEETSIEHQYAKAGEYVIRFVPEDDAVFSFIGDSCSTRILHKTLDYSYKNEVYGTAIKKIEIGEGMTEFGGRCFNCSALESVTIPKEITSFNNAFQGCTSLKVVTFPQGVLSLTVYGMRGCRMLEKLLFSDAKISLLGTSVADCYNLKELILPLGISLNYSDIFSYCYTLRRVVFPKHAKKISGDIFEYCYSLKEVILNEELTEIGSSAFKSCEALNEICIPESVAKIGSSAFYHCFGLRRINLPSKLTVIYANTFYSCYSLTEITIPNEVTEIQYNAFNNCLGMEHYYMFPTTPPTMSDVSSFSGIPDGCKIHVPKGCLEAYQSAENWSIYADYMVEMEA